MKRTKKFLVGLLAALSVLSVSLGLTACGQTENSQSSLNESSGILYEISEDETYALVVGYDGASKELKIADTYNGLPVMEIGEYAFFNCTNLTSIDIPDSVKIIGKGAFNNCSGVTYVGIGSSVELICKYAFDSCESLTSIVIPSSVMSIADDAFNNCYRLVEIINNSRHITIKKGGYDNGDIGLNALAVYNSSDTFTTTKLSNDNDYIVYTDNEKKILVGYIGKETVLTIPNYITNINAYAFFDNERLTSVTIPKSVKSIGSYSFGFCERLMNIKFSGPQVEWHQITKGIFWAYDVPASKVACSYGEVAIEHQDLWG